MIVETRIVYGDVNEVQVPFINWDEFEEQAKRFAIEKSAEVELKSKSDARLQQEIMASQQQSQY